MSTARPLQWQGRRHPDDGALDDNGRGDTALSMGICYCGEGSASGGTAQSMGVRCEYKGRAGGGTGLSMSCCNGNGGECTTLLMARCDGNGRGDTALSIGACYDGKGSGGGGAWHAAM